MPQFHQSVPTYQYEWLIAKADDNETPQDVIRDLIDNEMDSGGNK